MSGTVLINNTSWVKIFDPSVNAYSAYTITSGRPDLNYVMVFSNTAPANNVTAYSYISETTTGNHTRNNTFGAVRITSPHSTTNAYARLLDGSKGSVIITQS